MGVQFTKHNVTCCPLHSKRKAFHHLNTHSMHSPSMAVSPRLCKAEAAVATAAAPAFAAAAAAPAFAAAAAAPALATADAAAATAAGGL